MLAESRSVACWQPPGWATRSRIEEGGIRHAADLPARLSALGDDDTEVFLPLGVTQLDALDAGRATVEVIREGSPVVRLDGLRLTLVRADALGRALLALVEQVRSVEP